MEKSKNNLKIMSIIILAMTGVSLIRLILSFVMTDFNVEELPEEMTEEVYRVTLIVILAISLVCLIPQIYVGFKGLKMSKNPDSSGAHIVWATILFVLSIIALISPVRNLIDGGNIGDNVTALIDCLIDVVIFFSFIKYAKEIRASAR